MRKLTVIDADSIIYLLGWTNRDHQDEYVMAKAVNDFMVELVQTTDATHYLGVFSPKKTFRNDVATLRPYKGNRPPSAEWLDFWKPRIISQCVNDFGFFTAHNIEADDVLSIMRNGAQEGDSVILTSPDKDLQQVPGRHYNYSKKIWTDVSPEQGLYNFWKQVMVGDTTDNIAGVKGVGPKKAEAVLKECSCKGNSLTCVYDAFCMGLAVQDQFAKVYKEDWHEIYKETVSLVKLLEPTEELVLQYSSHIQQVLVKDDDSKVQELLNTNKDGVLQSSERSHTDDILCPPADLSE